MLTSRALGLPALAAAVVLVGYAEAQIRPLATIHAGHPALQQALDALCHVEAS
jgi:hypothetical protein